MSTAIAKQASAVLKNHPQGEPSALVNVLHDIQGEFCYLPEEALRLASEHLQVSTAQVFGVASFFEGFHLKPRGKHICTVCMGTACHVRGAPRLIEQAERDLDISSGQTTKDMQFTIEEVNCVGACALGPLVIMDGEYNGNMTPHRLTKLVNKIQKKKGK